MDFLSVEYYKGKGMSRLFSNFFEKNFLGIPGPGEIVENGNKPTPGVGFTHCDILLFWAWMDLEKLFHEIKI